MDELGATKSISSPKIKLLINIIFSNIAVGKQYNVLSPGLRSKKSSRQCRVNHILLVHSN
jgi:hypothetical protein